MSLRSQITKTILLLMPGIVLLGVIAAVSIRFDIDISRFTRDPLAIAGGHPFLGVISNLGAILWSSAAAICLFTAAQTPRPDAGRLRLFILLGGLITVMLLLDDLFMLHERVYTHYLGINEKLVFLGYGGLVLIYLAAFRKQILESDFVLLATALGLFAVSILIDRLPDDVPPMHHLYEDGSKFLGILTWLGYQVSVCRRYLSAVGDRL